MNKSICTFPRCKNFQHGKGYCDGHLRQLREGRELQPLRKLTRVPASERLSKQEYQKKWLSEHPENVKRNRHQTYLNQKSRDPEEYNRKASSLQAQWRKNNLNKSKELNRQSYARNREERLAEKRQYAIDHPDRISLNNRVQHKRRSQLVPLEPELIKPYIEIIQNDPCAYCGSYEDIQIDHIAPVAKGGSPDWDNLTAACRKCNQSKNARRLLVFLCQK